MFTNYDLSKKYIVACSGGPDSMALLDMLRNHNFNIVVAMVNYKTRLESDDEENLVRSYCDKYNIKCVVSIFDEKQKGNFEDIARKYRYNFFANLYQSENASGLFVAHHKDDVIETEGVVVEAMPGATFKVKIAGGHIVTAYLSGKLWKNFIRVYEGDTVKLEISPYDLTRGRIIWRSK